MKIVHCCLSNFYADGFAYQENELVRRHIDAGHAVTVIASTETFGADRKICYIQPADYMGQDGARVVRLPYSRGIPKAVARKLRCHPAVFALLADLRPDAILFHGTCGWELNTVARYVRKNPAVRLYVDSHEDFYNSARTLASKWLLHWSFYRPILLRNLDCVQKVLCITPETIDFVSGFYGVPKSKVELFPLGGYIADDAEYASHRNAKRRELGVVSGQIVLLQSGKFDRAKRLGSALRAFAATAGTHLRYFVAGQLMPETKDEIEALIAADSRVTFLGWLDSDQLRAVLYAADVYVQPGSQSATMQMSLCCRCGIVLDDVPSHRMYLEDNGYLVKDERGLHAAFAAIARSDASVMASWSANSQKLAEKYLDYRTLAKRLLQ